MNEKPSREKLEEIFNDNSDEGQMKFSQFKDALAQCYVTPSNSDLSERFKIFSDADTNNDNKLSFEEFESMFEQLWRPMDDSLNDIIQSIEFMSKGEPLTLTDLKDILKDSHGKEPLTEDEINDIFETLDADDDQFITPEEIREFLKGSSDKVPTPSPPEDTEEVGEETQEEPQENTDDATQDNNDEPSQENTDDAQENADDAQENGDDVPQENDDDAPQENVDDENKDNNDGPQEQADDETPNGETAQDGEGTPTADETTPGNTDELAQNGESTQANSDDTKQDKTVEEKQES